MACEAVELKRVFNVPLGSFFSAKEGFVHEGKLSDWHACLLIQAWADRILRPIKLIPKVIKETNQQVSDTLRVLRGPRCCHCLHRET